MVRLALLLVLLGAAEAAAWAGGGAPRRPARVPRAAPRALGKGFGAPAKGKAPKAAAAAKKADAPPAKLPRHYTGSQRKGELSPRRPVPDAIAKPDYHASGRPGYVRPILPWDIEVKGPDEIAKMREACAIAREVLDIAGAAVAAGVATDEIDAIVHAESLKRGAYPSPLNYCGFPKSVCTSVNEVVCHGIPDSTVLRDGDIVNVDVTCYVGGVHGDLSETFAVGGGRAVDAAGRRLVKVTHDAWQAAIGVCAPGVPYKAIGAAIEEVVAPTGLTIVRGFVGHGIGSAFHMPPNVVHHRNEDRNGVMEVGHTFTIEPMINEGVAETLEWPDGWTIVTKDGGRSAQFEHTLLVVEGGVEILTARTANSQPRWWEEEPAADAAE